MNEHNRFKKYAWLLVLLLICLGYFGIKCLYRNDKAKEENIFNEYPQKSESSSISLEVNDLLTETNVNLDENFKDKEYQYKDKQLNYKITCIDYNQEYLNSGEKYSCRSVEIQLQYRLYRLYTNPNNCQRKIYVILYDDYIIEHIIGDCDDSCGTINIYNQGNLLKTIKNVNANPKLTNLNDYNYVKKVDNNIYYFQDVNKYTYLNKLDLNNLNLSSVELAKVKNENFGCENK